MKRELNGMNAIACLLVILIHVLASGVTAADPASWQAAFIYIPWRLALFAVPMFLYTAAVKMELQFGGKKITAPAYGRYCLARLRKVYLPYALWFCVYFAYYAWRGYVPPDAGLFCSELFICGLSYQFYYIAIIMQFYLTMPLWVWLAEHVPFWIALPACVPAMLFTARSGLRYSDRICLTYCVFWCAGLYAGKYYDRFLNVIRRKSVMLLCGLTVASVCLASLGLYAGGGQTLLTQGAVKNASDLASIILLHALCLGLKNGGLADRLLEKIHRASFSVYLSHCLFLAAVTGLMRRMGVTRLSVLLIVYFVTCYTLPFLLYFSGELLRRKKTVR